MSDPETRTWRCTVCGYVHQGEEPPDYCPVCGALRDDFEPYALPAAPASAVQPVQWRCLNCNYVHDGDAPPEICPICGVARDRFEPVDAAPPAGHADDAIRVVIVGGGIAGVAAAQAVREAAPASSVTLLCSEPEIPYYRLNLTRYLAGEIQRDVLPIHPPAWYEDCGIDLRIGVGVRLLSPADKSMELETGESVPYDRLILAMGSHAFVPPMAGVDLPGVVTLRTATDAEAILERVRTDPRCVVIGGGILGIEAAGALGKLGVQVDLIESHEWLMPRQLNRPAAARLESHIAALGVRVRKPRRTKAILGDQAVSGILLDDDQRLEAPLVILATGVRPNTYLARKAGLEVDKGIVVNNRLRTSDADIYAAGDVAEHNGRLYGAWAPSQYQGNIAGLNAVGIPTEFGGLPRSNALKVLGVDLMSIGRFEPEDGSYEVLAAETERAFAHFVFHDGRLVGSILMGYPSLSGVVKHAVEGGTDFSALLRGAPTGDGIVRALAEKQVRPES